MLWRLADLGVQAQGHLVASLHAKILQTDINIKKLTIQQITNKQEHTTITTGFFSFKTSYPN